jgi:hypothetical protein
MWIWWCEMRPCYSTWNETQQWQVLSIVLRPLTLQLNPPLPYHFSYNPHLHSLGLGMATFHWHNGTLTMWAGCCYCAFQKHCVTFVTFDLRKDDSKNIFGWGPRNKNAECDKTTLQGTVEVMKNIVFMGLFQGMYKVNDGSLKTILKGTTDRGFNVQVNQYLNWCCWNFVMVV